VGDSDIHGAYREAGVDYTVLDAGKRSALEQALQTSHWLAAAGACAFEESRGEPAFVLRVADSTLAFVLETLGTKSIVAREYHELTGANHFADVAYDTVAAVLNDLVCVAALSLVLNAYFATGSSAWYEHEDRARALLEGWPPVTPVLALLAEHAQLAPSAAYSTLNMGAGFAVYCGPGGGQRTVAAAARLGFDALLAGTVHEGPRQVVLEPLDVVYRSDQLELAPR
jgi:phosphoribosylaminoimidazole (AIR) synthetase